jgi:hypothetical protein
MKLRWSSKNNSKNISESILDISMTKSCFRNVETTRLPSSANITIRKINLKKSDNINISTSMNKSKFSQNIKNKNDAFINVLPSFRLENVNSNVNANQKILKSRNINSAINFKNSKNSTNNKNNNNFTLKSTKDEILLKFNNLFRGEKFVKKYLKGRLMNLLNKHIVVDLNDINPEV